MQPWQENVRGFLCHGCLRTAFPFHNLCNLRELFVTINPGTIWTISPRKRVGKKPTDHAFFCTNLFAIHNC